MKAMKIYGIHGLLEWHGTIHSNGITMKVDFTNGSTTAYGVAPATYITKNELTQRIIENSDEFKSGRIKLVRAVILEKDEPKKTAEASTQSKKEYAGVTKTQEAKEILRNEYGYNVDGIRSKAEVIAAAAELKISFPDL